MAHMLGYHVRAKASAESDVMCTRFCWFVLEHVQQKTEGLPGKANCEYVSSPWGKRPPLSLIKIIPFNQLIIICVIPCLFLSGVSVFSIDSEGERYLLIRLL
ncbi:hypothetical protein ABZP36_018681 [Zizania latifolia]